MTAYPGRDLEAMSALSAYPRFVWEALGGAPRGRVLEIGAGIGGMAAHYLAACTRAVLVEPDAGLCQQLRATTQTAPHAAVFEGTLEDAVQRAPDLIPPQGFDAVVLVNVLEHVLDDTALLRLLKTRVAPGGRLLLFVPALPVLYGTLDSAVGHHRRYRRARLNDVVTAAGFTVNSLRYVDILGALPWFVAGRVLRRPHLDPQAARLYDLVGVPLTRAVERWMTPPFGKNLACIATVTTVGP